MSVTVDIKRRIGVLKTYPTGWKKELNIVDWNGSGDKYDIREWSSNHETMSRGLTFTKEEAQTLYELLKSEFEERR